MLLSANDVQDAFEWVQPAIERLLGTDADPAAVRAKRPMGHLRVSIKREYLHAWALLWHEDFGDRAEWPFPFEEHATSKEEISQRTGMSTRAVQTVSRHLLCDDDTIYFGSVTNGVICVAFSGVEAYFDELIAKWMLAALEAIWEHKLEQAKQRGTDTYLVEEITVT